MSIIKTVYQVQRAVGFGWSDIENLSSDDLEKARAMVSWLDSQGHFAGLRIVVRETREGVVN